MIGARRLVARRVDRIEADQLTGEPGDYASAYRSARRDAYWSSAAKHRRGLSTTGIVRPWGEPAAGHGLTAVGLHVSA
jgi:hypothetical protein